MTDPNKPLLVIGAASVLISALLWARCLFRPHSKPVRHPLGGMRCKACGKPSDDLAGLGLGDGYVSSGWVRRTLSGHYNGVRH